MILIKWIERTLSPSASAGRRRYGNGRRRLWKRKNILTSVISSFIILSLNPSPKYKYSCYNYNLILNCCESAFTSESCTFSLCTTHLIQVCVRLQVARRKNRFKCFFSYDYILFWVISGLVTVSCIVIIFLLRILLHVWIKCNIT